MSTAANQAFEKTEASNLTHQINANNALQLQLQKEQARLDGQIRDHCFALNLPDVSQKPDLQGQAYAGLVSLCSTTVQHFMYGVYCGPDAALACETSSFISLRAGGCAIMGLNPKQLKFLNGSI